MGLVALVDDGSGGAETLPDLVAELLGHGAEVFPLLVEFLQFLEGFYHVLVCSEGFGLLAEGGLGFQVLLEVQVAEFAVDVHQVVELGDIQLIRIVYVAEILLGNRADLAPAVLDVTELGEGVLHVAGLLDQGLELFDDGLLLGEVLLAQGVLFLIIFGPLFLVFHVQRLEAGLDGGEGAHGATLHRHSGIFCGGVFIGFHYLGVFAGSGFLLGKLFIEGGLDGLGLLEPLHAVFTVFQFLEQGGELGEGLFGEIHRLFCGLFYDLCYICSHFLGHRLNFFTHALIEVRLNINSQI